MTFDAASVERLRADYPECFACGRENGAGLGMDDFRVDEEGIVTATFIPRPEFAGFANTLHGGVVATALDEGSAWAAIMNHGVLVFTAKLEIRFREKAAADRSYRIVSRVDEHRGTRFRIAAALLDGDTTVAESKGLFVTAYALGDVFED